MACPRGCSGAFRLSTSSLGEQQWRRLSDSLASTQRTRAEMALHSCSSAFLPLMR